MLRIYLSRISYGRKLPAPMGVVQLDDSAHPEVLTVNPAPDQCIRGRAPAENRKFDLAQDFSPADKGRARKIPPINGGHSEVIVAATI